MIGTDAVCVKNEDMLVCIYAMWVRTSIFFEKNIVFAVADGRYVRYKGKNIKR